LKDPRQRKNGVVPSVLPQATTVAFERLPPVSVIESEAGKGRQRLTQAYAPDKC